MRSGAFQRNPRDLQEPDRPLRYDSTMRCLARRARMLCTLLSAALLVAASVMWVRSYWRHDAKMSKHGRVQRSVSSVLGGVRYLRVDSAYTVRPEHEDFNWYS